MRNGRLLLPFAALLLLAPPSAAKSPYQKILDKNVAGAEKTAKQLFENFEKLIKSKKKLPAGDPQVDLAAQTLLADINGRIKSLRDQIRTRICSAAESIEIQAQVTQQPIPETYRAGKNGKWDKFVQKMRKILEDFAKKAQKELDEFAKHAKKKWGRTTKFSLPKPDLGTIGAPGVPCPQPKRKARVNAAMFDNGSTLVMGDADGQNVAYSWGNANLGPMSGTASVDNEGAFQFALTADVFGQAIQVTVSDADDACPQESDAVVSL